LLDLITCWIIEILLHWYFMKPIDMIISYWNIKKLNRTLLSIFVTSQVVRFTVQCAGLEKMNIPARQTAGGDQH